MTGLDKFWPPPLIALLEQALRTNTEIYQRVAALEEQNRPLRAHLPGSGGGTTTPAWVKPKRPGALPKLRKKRPSCARSAQAAQEAPKQLRANAPRTDRG